LKIGLPRMLSTLVITGLLLGAAVAPSTAQDASPSIAPQASPSAEVPAVTTPTAEEFMASLSTILPSQEVVDSGKLQHKARQYADQARAYLLSVVPDPCYYNMYASAWGVATALQQWADKGLTKPEVLLRNTYSQFVESPQAITCAAPADAG
jgi:hypothetical protein